MAVITVSNTGGNWSSSTTWVGGVVPISGDSVNFTSTSGNLTVNVSTANLVGIDFTNYTGTCTFTNSINTSGTINLGSGGYTQAGANGLTIVGNTTIITNGVVWSRTFSLNSGTITLTLNDNFNLSGSFTASGLSGALTLSFGGIGQFLPTGTFIIGTQTPSTLSATITITLPNDISVTTFTTNNGSSNYRNIVLNGSKTISVSGNIGLMIGTQSLASLTGNCTIKAIGSGNITCGVVDGPQYTATISISLTIDTLGTYIFLYYPFFTSSTIIYTSGTITGASCRFTTCTLNLNAGGQWGTDVVIRGSTTLTSDATFGNLTTQTTAVVFSGAFTINVKGNLSINITTSGLSTPIVINGTGNQSWTHDSAVYLSNNLTINKASGTLTLGPNVYYRTGILRYNNIGGIVDTTTNSSILNIGGSTTLNTSAMSWYRLICATTATITLTSNLNITNYAQYYGGTITHPGGGVYNLTGDLYIGNNISSTNVTFTNTDINIVNLFVNLRSSYTYVVNNGSANINISGNYTLNNMDNSSGTITCTPIRLVGNGTWSCTTTVAGFYSSHSGNITIDTAGTITFGTIVFLGGGTISKLSGNINLTGNTFFYVTNGTINTPDITWNNVFFASGGASTMTLASNLYVANTFTCGGQGTINGAFDIYCGNCTINNSSSGAVTVSITHSGIIYCSNNLTYNGASNICQNSGTVYVGGSVFFNAPAANGQGAANTYMVGNGVISSNINYPINTNLYFNTGGKITISGPINFANGTARTINLIRGNVDASKCDLYLNQNLNHTLTNMHKIAWKSVNVRGTTTILTMNEFFCGKPNLKTIVTSTVASNYTVIFTDNFEKIAKFVTITNCTLSKPQQLLIITDSKKSSTNTRGIRYINNLPNGISKNNPSTSTQTTYSTNMLVGDPSMISNI
jgi:hypothetical protein